MATSIGTSVGSSSAHSVGVLGHTVGVGGAGVSGASSGTFGAQGFQSGWVWPVFAFLGGSTSFGLAFAFAFTQNEPSLVALPQHRSHSDPAHLLDASVEPKLLGPPDMPGSETHKKTADLVSS